MTEYAIWKPEHDGHAPPNWREGMNWAIDRGPREQPIKPRWYEGFSYAVPAEALNSPNDDVETPEAVETGKLENIVRGLRQYPAEELAKHGITLAPEKDWATELWADLFAVRGMPSAAKSTREGRLDDEDQAAIALIRGRVVLKGEG